MVVVSDDRALPVARATFNAVAERMRIAMIKTAYNIVISESLDFGVAVFDRDINMIAQGTGIPHGSDDVAREGILSDIATALGEAGHRQAARDASIACARRAAFPLSSICATGTAVKFGSAVYFSMSA